MTAYVQNSGSESFLSQKKKLKKKSPHFTNKWYSEGGSGKGTCRGKKYARAIKCA